MIERKSEVAGRAVGTGESWLTELSTAELKDVFKLRKEALEENEPCGIAISSRVPAPRKAKGGIKAESKHGAFGTELVGAALDQGVGELRHRRTPGTRPLLCPRRPGAVHRRAEGRGHGQGPGIAAETLRRHHRDQGSRRQEWTKLAEGLSRQAIFLAKLLVGEMPQDVEQVFKDAGLSLFPEKLRDLSTDCSCPDDSNPCKHIAAVYYLLGEEFDRDPFLLFRLRGLEREKLMEMLSPPPPHRQRRRPNRPPLRNRWRRTPGCSGKARPRRHRRRKARSATCRNRQWLPPCRSGWASFRSGAARRICSTPLRRCTTPLRRKVWASSSATNRRRRGHDALRKSLRFFRSGHGCSTRCYRKLSLVSPGCPS